MQTISTRTYEVDGSGSPERQQRIETTRSPGRNRARHEGHEQQDDPDAPECRWIRRAQPEQQACHDARERQRTRNANHDPMITRPMACRSTIARIWDRLAPSALRTPISRVRCATA